MMSISRQTQSSRQKISNWAHIRQLCLSGREYLEANTPTLDQTKIPTKEQSDTVLNSTKHEAKQLHRILHKDEQSDHAHNNK